MSDPTTGRLGMLQARLGVAHDSAADERLNFAEVPGRRAHRAKMRRVWGRPKALGGRHKSRESASVGPDSVRIGGVNDRFDGLLFDAGQIAVRHAPAAVAVRCGGRPTLRRLTVWSPFAGTHDWRV